VTNKEVISVVYLKYGMLSRIRVEIGMDITMMMEFQRSIGY
jgi:hypothetical protein